MHLQAELLWLAAAIILSTIMGALAKRFRQPKVLGGLVAGILLGTALTGTAIMQSVRSHDAHLVILVDIAAALLLFRAGLEGNLLSIVKDAKTGWKVAVVGVIVPMVGGVIATRLMDDTSWSVAFFQGGVFAATSVGITVAVFKDLGIMNETWTKIVTSAAVIDDVLGLIVLTVCKAVAQGTADMSTLGYEIMLALAFVVVIPVVGHYLAPRLIGLMARLDIESREAVVIGWMLLYGGAAMAAGLAPIVGAYFAGVAIEELYFRGPNGHGHSDKPVEHFIDGLITALGPIFFVYAGASVDVRVFLDPHVLLHGLLFTAIAAGGKIVAGLVVRENRLKIGVAMIPRGEVGIIFASIGLQAGILTNELYGASMIMVLLTTMMTPPLLGWVARR